MSGYSATAAFRICGQQSEVKKLALYDGYSATQTEIDLLDEFGEDGRANYPLFHVDDEACSIQRPISDLILIWHHDRIEASNLCLHLYNRKHFLELHEIKAAQNAWEGETASNIFVRDDESDITKTEEPCKLKSRLNFWFVDQPPGEANLWNPLILNLDPQTRVDTMPRLVMRELVSVLQKDPSMISLQNGKSKIHFGQWRQQSTNHSSVGWLRPFFSATNQPS